MNRKVVYGVIAVIVLAVLIGGAMATASAQNTNYEIRGQARIIPPGLEIRAWSKWRWRPSPGFVQVSPEYNQTVMGILESNEEASRLLGQGYRVVFVKPIIRACVEGDGTVVFKAQQALVVLSNGSTTITYLVDISSGTVTHIATINTGLLKELRGPSIRGTGR